MQKIDPTETAVVYLLLRLVLATLLEIADSNLSMLGNINIVPKYQFLKRSPLAFICAYFS